MWISIDQILCLRAIYQTGSLTKAADSIFRAKSAVNYSIKTLEKQLRFKVLDKGSYRCTLTPKGEEFLFKSQALLKEYDALIENAKMIHSGIEMKLNISVSAICSSSRLFQIIKEASQLFPSTEINLIQETLSGEKMLDDQLVDLALLEDLHNQHDFEYIIVQKLELLAVISSTHPYISQKQSTKNLKNIPHIIQQSSIEKSALSRGVDQDALNWYVSDLSTKKEIITSGLGYGRIPLHTIEKELQEQSLTKLFLENKPLIMDVFLCRKKDKLHGALSNFIWQSFSE